MNQIIRIRGYDTQVRYNNYSKSDLKHHKHFRAQAGGEGATSTLSVALVCFSQMSGGKGAEQFLFTCSASSPERWTGYISVLCGSS